MGRGDKKTRKGKVAMGSYGKLRPRSEGKKKVVKPAPVAEEEKK